MTREELITIAAVEHADKQLQRVDEFDFAVAAIADYDNGFTDGFKQGAQWADAHPQSSREEFIEKACKWLGKHINKTASIDADGDWGDDYLEVNNYDDEDMFLSAFRKAMEE